MKLVSLKSFPLSLVFSWKPSKTSFHLSGSDSSDEPDSGNADAESDNKAPGAEANGVDEKNPVRGMTTGAIKKSVEADEWSRSVLFQG